MNEQLLVKNFGPIKDATVDFKRVTVFIGPTGGGKSTLAKLAAIFHSFQLMGNTFSGTDLLGYYNLKKFHLPQSDVKWNAQEHSLRMKDGVPLPNESLMTKIAQLSKEKRNQLAHATTASPLEELVLLQASIRALMPAQNARYISSERAFVSAIEYSWAGLIRDDIGLAKYILDFANNFSLARKDVSELNIPFVNVKYLHQNGQDFIKVPGSETLFRLYEAASGIQSVTPLLVLLEHLSRNTEQAQSFIIEEPELNLFPLAQFELVKILVDKCARLDGKNDLVLTTHSPYVLTALNLLCYAYRIAQQDEATAKKVAKLIPRHCWIDPDQFAAYYVDQPGTKRKQQVRSIINKKTGLIEENELDTASDELGTIFDKLVRLRKPATTPARLS